MMIGLPPSYLTPYLEPIQKLNTKSMTAPQASPTNMAEAVLTSADWGACESLVSAAVAMVSPQFFVESLKRERKKAMIRSRPGLGRKTYFHLRDSSILIVANRKKIATEIWNTNKRG